MAPEMLLILLSNDEGEMVTSSSDIFSAGCTVFYYVTRGTHPFSADHRGYFADAPSNIIKNTAVNIENYGKGLANLHGSLSITYTNIFISNNS